MRLADKGSIRALQERLWREENEAHNAAREERDPFAYNYRKGIAAGLEKAADIVGGLLKEQK